MGAGGALVGSFHYRRRRRYYARFRSNEITAQTALVHSDGRRLLVYGELRGSLEEEGPGAAGDGAEIHVETGLGLFLDDVAPEDAARRLGRLAVRAEPIELDSLFAVTQPDAAMLS